MTQENFDKIGRRLAKLQAKHGKDSEKLTSIKCHYEVYSRNTSNQEAYGRLEAAIKKVEDYDEPDMSPVFMNIG